MQAWCCLQVKLCDPCLSALCVPWCKKALYKYSSFPFLFTFDCIAKIVKSSTGVPQYFPKFMPISVLFWVVTADSCWPPKSTSLWCVELFVYTYAVYTADCLQRFDIRKSIWLVNTEWWGAGLLEQRAYDLHIIIICCFIKIQIGLTFLVWTCPGCPEKEAVKWMSVVYITG